VRLYEAPLPKGSGGGDDDNNEEEEEAEEEEEDYEGEACGS